MTTMIPSHTPAPNLGRKFEEFRQAGFLWLINASVFHPRGFALAFVFDTEGRATGWELLGDGTERFAYDETDPVPVDECFTDAEEEFARTKLKNLGRIINEDRD